MRSFLIPSWSAFKASEYPTPSIAASLNPLPLLMHGLFSLHAVTLLAAAALLTIIPASNAEEPAAQKRVTHLDLKDKMNQKLWEDLHGFEGNSFSELPQGDVSFQDIKFHVGEGYIRLGGTVEKDKPLKVEDLPVGKTFSKLQILHGTGYGSYGSPGSPLFIFDGAQIGEYVVKYDDGTTASIPIVYGQDVRDWWNWDKPAEVTRGKIAWSGRNEMSRGQGQQIHIYLTTWTNPHPTKKVTGLDYISNGKTAASPYCIAITLEH